jgi:hypothetical protein
VEVALAAKMQHSAMAHVAESTSKGYVGPWNAFVKWCGDRLSERCPLPATDFAVALYLQSVADGAKSFAPAKNHLAAIASFQKVNLFNHLPTQSPVVCMVRQATTRKFGLSPKNRKAPFKWADVVIFATLLPLMVSYIKDTATWWCPLWQFCCLEECVGIVMLVASVGATFGLMMTGICMQILTTGAVRTLSLGFRQPSGGSVSGPPSSRA